MNTYDHIHEQLSALLGGDVWYGENLIESIAGLSPEQAMYRIKNTTKNIAEIIYHLTAWNKFAVAKLDSDTEFEVRLNSEQDWKPIAQLSEPIWQEMKRNFFQGYQEIVEHYDGMERAGLSEIVPGRGYDFRFLIQGIIEHNIYHLAQINLIKSVWNQSH